MNPASPMPFGALLRRHRLAASLTQAMLAERASVSERAVNDLERDPRRPRPTAGGGAPRDTCA